MVNKKLIAKTDKTMASATVFDQTIKKLERTPALRFSGKSVFYGISADAIAIVLEDNRNCVLFYEVTGKPLGTFLFKNTGLAYEARITEIKSSPHGIALLSNTNQVIIQFQGEMLLFKLRPIESGIDIAMDKTQISIVSHYALYQYDSQTKTYSRWKIPYNSYAAPKSLAIVNGLVFLSDIRGAITVYMKPEVHEKDQSMLKIKTVLQIFIPAARDLVMTPEIGDQLLTHSHAFTPKPDSKKTLGKTRDKETETGKFEQRYLASSKRLQELEQFILDDQFKRIAHLDSTPITKIMILENSENGIVIAAQSTHGWQVWRLAFDVSGVITVTSVTAKKESHTITAATSIGTLFIYATAENKVKIYDFETESLTPYQLLHGINQITVSNGCLFCCDAGSAKMTVISRGSKSTFIKAATGIQSTEEKLLLQTSEGLALIDFAADT